MDKKIVVILDPKTRQSETMDIDTQVLEIAKTLEKIRAKTPEKLGPVGEVKPTLKQDMLEFMVSCLRPEVISMACNMESKLRMHDGDRKETWKELSYTESMIRLLGKVEELKQAILEKRDPLVISEKSADIGNFAMFIFSNYQRKFENTSKGADDFMVGYIR